MLRNRKQERDFVEFLDVEELKLILNPVSSTSVYSINKFIDRYIDAQMKEHIKNKINWSNIDEDMELKLRWVLEFKKFLNEIK